MKSVPEGSVFLVPWRNVDREDQWPGLLVVARRVPRTSIVGAYLFARASDDAVGGRQFDLPAPADAVASAKLTATVMTEEWPALGVHPGFRREEWPFAEVVRPSPGGDRWIAKKLDDRHLLKVVGERVVSAAEAARLPSDNLEAGAWPSYKLRELDDERRRRELDSLWGA